MFRMEIKELDVNMWEEGWSYKQKLATVADIITYSPIYYAGCTALVWQVVLKEQDRALVSIHSVIVKWKYMACLRPWAGTSCPAWIHSHRGGNKITQGVLIKEEYAGTYSTIETEIFG